MKKKKIAIVADNAYRYYQFFDLNVYDVEEHHNRMSFSDIALIIFTGGEDVTPAVYKAKAHPLTSNNLRRDRIELDILGLAAEYNIPTLGFCRGSQFLYAANGYGLLQHVENHSGSHEVDLVVNNKVAVKDAFYVTSTHHQMMNPMLIDDNVEVIAIANNGGSRQGESTKDIVDVPYDLEICFLKKQKALCIQGHPEYDSASKEFKLFTTNLITTKLLL